MITILQLLVIQYVVLTLWFAWRTHDLVSDMLGLIPTTWEKTVFLWILLTWPASMFWVPVVMWFRRRAARGRV